MDIFDNGTEITIGYMNIEDCDNFGGFSYTDENGEEVCLNMNGYNSYLGLHSINNGQQSVKIHIDDLQKLRQLINKAEQHLRDVGRIK